MHSALVNFDARFGTACDSQSLRKGQAGRDGGRDSLCALLRSDWAAQASISAFALTRCFSLLSVGVPSFPPCSPQPFKQHSKREAISSLQMGLVSFSKVIMPALAGTCVVSYAFWDLSRNRKLFGGTVPITAQNSEWEKETGKKLDAWPREAAGPVVMNPISRQNYHKA
ncbi:uncharacterized protein [Physcomitrium patens]|uniref:Uncharacterized protein n=2 Tax=Physcomitrium patens TaxID=3218 RepID=A0A2K1J348_PHYPA|nr:uncharacterized protein LOC112294028 [Physcomitrium patens]XP_024399923.1 uncharacterized protein LOC112294047 [Physcomitrium patens]PNR35958.1 hypothetical protein PHYPA_021808 [Physcomitrium patens]PNR35960.1 hypothetical protein PHYPA_021810 [Physcomitrium patens]|eukprot:XP_024399880.1 uncharacterized protein LOC112294028 [Physcomitrella patens]